jgi:processive 1,2-diacylglycerol beta-glucosyltransferase
MEGKTLAILSVSAGAGHIRAAESLKRYAQILYPGMRTEHIDVMDIVPPLFKKMYADSYIKIVESHPNLWGYLYRKADKEKSDSTLNRLRRGIERLNTRKFSDMLTELAPDHVICTHFLPAELISRLKQENRFDPPVWVQVTDFDIHAMWVHKYLDGYFAASEEVAWRMVDRGLDREHIVVSGIPIMPAFREPLSRSICAAELELNPEKFTILMMSGGAGLGGIETMAERLLELPDDFQIIALSGRNFDLLEKLRRLADAHPHRLHPMGFTDTIEKLMTCADLAITKSGGLTSSECLAMGLPMIVISPIPGQEERNADYLLEHGAALKAYDAAGLKYRVHRLLNDRALLAGMKKNALAIARPLAAKTVLETALGR